jgi:hypothetical protein
MHKLFFILLFINLLNTVLSQGKIENTNQNNAPAIPQSSTFTNSVNTSNNFNLDTLQFIHVVEDEEIIQSEEYLSQPKSNSSIKKKTRTKSDDNSFSESDKKEEKSEKESSSINVSQQFSTIYELSRMQDSRRSPTREQQIQLDKMVENLKNIDQNSIEYHLKMFVAGNYNIDLKDHLMAAYRLNSTNSEVLNQMVAVSIIESDTAKAKTLFNQLMVNKQLDQSYIDYGSDMLVSTPTNSTLITHSFNDSYGVIYNQFSNALRTDVTVINLDFCQSADYRKQLQQKGYKIPVKTVIDISFFSDFIALNSDKTIALSLTLPKSYFLNSPIDLFTSGLVFCNVSESSSNLDLFEKSMHKKVLFRNDVTSKKLALNYLPILLEIRKAYTEMKQTEKVREVDKLIDAIATGSKSEKQIHQMKNKN